MGFFDSLIWPLKWAIAWIIVIIHKALIFIGMPDGSGAAWVLAIVGMTLLIRSAIIPLYFRQIMAQRNMQVIQPEMKAVRDKYKGRKDPVSQQQQQQEIMALYKKYNANPLSSCWPMLIQIPVFLALFRVLASTGAIANGTYNGGSGLGPMDSTIAQQIEDSTFLGAPLSASFMTSWQADQKVSAFICLALVVLMAFTMYLTQKMMMTKNMPKSSDPNDMQMRMMKTMTYTMPIIMGVTGIAFQVGVLIYWLTSNVFMAVQQTYTIHKMPAPGSEAHKKMLTRHKEKYRVFHEGEEATLQAKYEQLNVDASSVAAAHAAVSAAEVRGEENPRTALDQPNLPGVNQELDRDALWEAVQARQAHEEKLRERRIKLQLEKKPLKEKKAAPTPVVDRERVQPKRLTRAERAKLAKQDDGGSNGDGPVKPAKDRKQSRAQRREAFRNQGTTPNPKKKKKKRR